MYKSQKSRRNKSDRPTQPRRREIDKIPKKIVRPAWTVHRGACAVAAGLRQFVRTGRPHCVLHAGVGRRNDFMSVERGSDLNHTSWQTCNLTVSSPTSLRSLGSHSSATFVASVSPAATAVAPAPSRRVLDGAWLGTLLKAVPRPLTPAAQDILGDGAARPWLAIKAAAAGGGAPARGERGQGLRGALHVASIQRYSHGKRALRQRRWQHRVISASRVLGTSSLRLEPDAEAAQTVAAEDARIDEQLQ